MKIHGKTTFTWKNDVLYMETFGPFNEEGMVHTANEYQKTIVNKKCKSFCIIEIWDSETSTSPEGIQEMGKFWRTLQDSGCIALAVVASNNVQEWAAKSQLPVIGKIFQTQEDAEIWVNQNKT